MLCLVTESCPNLCDPMGCSPPGFSVHGDFPGKNTGVGSHGLLQGNFPNPGIKPRSFTLQADFLPAEAPGKPKNIGVGSLSLLQRSSQPGNQTRVSPALQVDSLPSELPGKCIYWWSRHCSHLHYWWRSQVSGSLGNMTGTVQSGTRGERMCSPAIWAQGPYSEPPHASSFLGVLNVPQTVGQWKELFKALSSYGIN